MSSLAPSGGTRPLASLALMAGPRYGEELPVPSPIVTLGRGAGCDVVLDDDSVSAQHARLEYDMGAWRITDLGSVNGTAVEGTRLAPNLPTPLPYGSTVRLGGVQLQFREAEGADVDAARAGYVPPEAPRTLREERSGARFPLWLVLLALLIAAVIGMIVYTNYARSAGTVAAPAPAPAQVSAPAATPAPAPLPAVPADSVPASATDSASAAPGAASDSAAAPGAGADSAAAQAP